MNSYLILIVTIVSAIINIGLYATIRFNDLRHLENTVGEIKNTGKHIESKVIDLCQRVSCIEGIISVGLPKTKRAKK